MVSSVTEAVGQRQEDARDDVGSQALDGDVQQAISFSEPTIVENDIATMLHEVFSSWKIETEVLTKTVQVLAEHEIGEYRFVYIYYPVKICD